VLPTAYFNAETLVVIISAYFAFGHKPSPEAWYGLDEKATLKVCIDQYFDFARRRFVREQFRTNSNVAPGADNRSCFTDTNLQPCSRHFLNAPSASAVRNGWKDADYRLRRQR
jgi:hypothetical protein